MIIFTGFHGSGTSAIVRAAQAGGIPFPGPHDCVEQQEFLGARAVNESVLHELTGHAWQRVPSYEALLAVPTSRTASIPDVNWKDPRGCVTLPVWRDRVNKVVWIKRSPLNTATTINRIHRVPKPQVIKLIAAYEYILFRTLLEFKIPYVITAYESWYKEQDLKEVARVFDFCKPGEWIGDEAGKQVLSSMLMPRSG